MLQLMRTYLSLALSFRAGPTKCCDTHSRTTSLEEAPIPSDEKVRQHPHLVRDRKDIPVALSIMQASVDYFVTYDRDFTDENETTTEVRAAIPGIMLPPVFLREVMGWTSEELEIIRYRTWSELESRL